MGIVTIAAAMIVGASLATSGATLQSVLRNPLAEPYILGLVGGASFGVALAFLMGWAEASAVVVPLAAFLGAGMELGTVFAFADICNALMCGPNLLCLAAMSGEACRAIREKPWKKL